jgi:type III secretion control protein HpaP
MGGAAGLPFASPDDGNASDHDGHDEQEQGAPEHFAGDVPRGEPTSPHSSADAAPSPPSCKPGAPAVQGPQAAKGSAPRTLRLQRAQSAKASDAPQPEHDTALGRHIVHACTAAAHGDLLTRELADRIARFCSMSGEGGESSWAVTLPMNPTVLPDTLLHLQLSPSSIAIRFETPNARALQLISDNADALRVRLADALGRHIDVEVAAPSI